MSLYMFYQEVEKGKWLPALASERERLIQTKKPSLVSALDVDSSFDHDLTLEETRALRYSGPMYFDWDAEDLEEATQQYQKFLTNLKAKGVNLDMLRLYATGKKGYHLEIPMPVFMGKPPANGTLFLPDMYREVAHSLFVETLDLRVYTSRRGRMWRCPNVLRDNGKYKVQITPEEAFGMDTEKYMQICSVPRLALPTEPPALNAELGLLFAQARDKVEAGAAKKKSKKQASDQLEKFKGQWPDTLQNIFTGAVVKPGVGWNHISLQLCIAASELGKSEEDLLADAAPLINSHESDSTRYNTPAKRTADLRDMHRYVCGNPCYEYSPGGILSLLLPEVRANADIALGDYTPEKTISEDGTVTVEDDEGDGAVKLAKDGIYVRTEKGYSKASDLGLRGAVSLYSLDGKSLGYEVEVLLDGESKGRHVLPMDRLLSRAALQQWASFWSIGVRTSDTAVSSIMDILGRMARKNSDSTLVVTREGVDVIVPRGAKSEDDYEIIFACPEKVHANKGGVYTFKNSLDKDGGYKSDLMDADPLTEADADLIENLFDVNSTKNMGKLLGWFCSTPMTQLFRQFYNQYPSLQAWGAAGSGKSSLTSLLNHIFYNVQKPAQLQSSSATPFAITARVASSASMPMILDELKVREMSLSSRNNLMNTLRGNYNGLDISRGGLSKDAGAKETITTNYSNVAPMAFVGEALESQSALLERCVIVAMNKSDRAGKEGSYHYVRSHATDLGRLGKALVERVMAMNLKQFRQEFDVEFQVTKDAIGERAGDFVRPVFNLTVASFGLTLLQGALRDVFGSRFDARIQEFRDSLTDSASDSIPSNMAEASRVLDVMAVLSRSIDVQYQIVNGQDYTVSADGRTVDLKLRPAFAKYTKWQRSLGQEVLFDNENAFIAGLSNYSGTIKRACPENVQLFDSPRATIFRLSAEYMDKENVDAFKS